jgi:RHS repeat-associated protein
VAERYKYTAYGKVTIYEADNITVKQNSTIGNRFMFTGREYDEETGLYYYRARYYSAEMGRFLQRDEIQDNDFPNLYEYVRNNPVGFTDPHGYELESDGIWHVKKGDNLTNIHRRLKPPKSEGGHNYGFSWKEFIRRVRANMGENFDIDKITPCMRIIFKKPCKTNESKGAGKSNTQTEVTSDDVKNAKKGGNITPEMSQGPQPEQPFVFIARRGCNNWRIRTIAGGAYGATVGVALVTFQIENIETGVSEFYTYIGGGALIGPKKIPFTDKKMPKLSSAGISGWAEFTTLACLTPEDFSGYVIIKSATAMAGAGYGGITIDWITGKAKGSGVNAKGWVTGVDISVSALHGAMIKR